VEGEKCLTIYRSGPLISRSSRASCLLHASVIKVVADSARKRLEPRQPVEFERSAATHWTEQAQALAASAANRPVAERVREEHRSKPCTVAHSGRMKGIVLEETGDSVILKVIPREFRSC
jgi:hypothetical protein